MDITQKMINTDIQLALKKLDTTLAGSLLLRAEGDGSDIRAFLGTVPRVRKFSETGGLIKSSLKDWKWSLANEPFGTGVEIPLKDWLRKNNNLLQNRSQYISQRCIESMLLYCLPLIENGTGTTLGTWFVDGLSFFNSAHKWKGGKVETTWSNSTSITVADPTAPTVEELADAWDAGVNLFYAMIDDFGQRIHPSPESSLYGIFPKNMRRGAKALLEKSVVKIDDVAQENPYKGAGKLHIEGGLSGTSAFYIGIDNPMEKPFIHQFEKLNGKDWNIMISDPNGIYAQEKNAVLITATGEQAFGYLWPHTMVRVALTAAT